MSGLEARNIQVLADDTLLIDGVDCSVVPGSITALIGPNGAGKSTLLRALAAIEHPAEGTVEFDGADLLGLGRRQRARLAAFVEQDTSTELSMTVRDVAALGRTPHESMWRDNSEASRRVIDDALDRVGMGEFADRDFTTLSGGERQRVMLAKALAQEPSLLLLDEPTNHLDISAQLSALAVLTSLAGTGATVLAALHDLNLAASWCESVIVLSGGRVVGAGPTVSTLTPELIREVYGVEAVLLTHPRSGRPVIALG